MQRYLFVLAVVSTIVIGSTAAAAQARTTRSEIGAARRGPVARLIELERRKNEWLRQTFLSR